MVIKEVRWRTFAQTMDGAHDSFYFDGGSNPVFWNVYN